MNLRINEIEKTIYNFGINKHRAKQLPQDEYTSDPITELKGVPKSYISFRAEQNKKIKYTPDADAILSSAKKVAEENNNAEITPFHIIKAIIDQTNNNILELDNNSEEEISLSSLHQLANNYAKCEILDYQETSNLFMYELNTLEDANNSVLAVLPKTESPDLQIDLSDDIKFELNEMLEEAPNTPVNDYILLASAFNSISKRNIPIAQDFISEFKSFGITKKYDEIKQNYMKEYNGRAIELWNKLALGSNLYVSYNVEPEEADRLIASFIKTINSKKYGNFNSRNTIIFPMVDSVKDVDLIGEINKMEEAYPNKQKIFIVNFDKFVLQNIDDDGNSYLSPEFIQVVKSCGDKTKFIFTLSNASHYQITQSPVLTKMLQGFLSYSIPPIQPYEAKEILKENKKLLKGIKTTFSEDAKDRVLYHAEKMEGLFPDKAIDLMKKISSYYGQTKKEITKNDVDKFSQVAYDMFNKTFNNTEIVYDTGKTLSTFYGKETTKKDIEAIIRQIKTGKIGTQGMIIYSKDEEAGSGRKYTAQTIAGETKIPFLEIDTSEFASDAQDDDGTKVMPKAMMSKIFSEIKTAARQNSYKTAMIYINNFEDFAFSGEYLAGYRQAMSQLAKEMEKAESEDVSILVVGSTEEAYADVIPLFVRGFKQNIVVDSPSFNNKARKEILEHRIEDSRLELDCANEEEKAYIIDKCVKLSEYMSFVEIKSLVDKTKQIMYERNKTRASLGDFIEAYLQLATGRTSRPEMPDYNKKATTSHECGHATNLEVMEQLMRDKGQPWHQSRNVNFITLDPRGNFLGAVFEGRSENKDYSFEAMFTGLVCAYGGYSCEKLFFDMDGSSGISQDLAQATAEAKRGIEFFGLGYNTGKISNAVGIKSAEYSANVFNDLNVILKNAQTVSNLITEVYRDFNEKFTSKYSKLIGTDDCMVDGDTFRKMLVDWKKSAPAKVKEEISIMEDMILDIIKHSKQGKLYK